MAHPALALHLGLRLGLCLGELLRLQLLLQPVLDGRAETCVATREGGQSSEAAVAHADRPAGAPKVCGPVGSYEDWTAAVRAPLIWLGQPDPCASMEKAREEDPELSAIRELFGHWQEHLTLSSGYTTSAITKVACSRAPTNTMDFNQQGFSFPEFRDLLLRQAGDGGAVNSRRLGKWLAKISNRVVDGYRIEMKIDGSNGNRFTLRRIEGETIRTEFDD